MPHIDFQQFIHIVGYPGIFAVVFAESGLFFGFFLPGDSFLFAAGLLAGQGFFNPWILIPGIVISAIAGDNVGYWFGAKVGEKFLSRPDSRFFKHSHIEQTKHFYEKYGNRTIFFARFFPIVRTFAPILAGVARMNYRTFITYNILGGIAWGAGVTLAGVFLGNVPFVQEYFMPIMLGIVVISVLPVLLHMRKQK